MIGLLDAYRRLKISVNYSFLKLLSELLVRGIADILIYRFPVLINLIGLE